MNARTKKQINTVARLQLKEFTGYKATENYDFSLGLEPGDHQFFNMALVSYCHIKQTYGLLRFKK